MVTRRARRWLVRGTTTAVVTGALVVLVATWLQAGSIASDWLAVSHSESAGSAVVESVAVGEIVLRDEGSAALAGTWGLTFEGGRAVVGDVSSRSEGRVRRPLVEITGALTPGTVTNFDRAVWGSDGARGRFGVESVEVPGSGRGMPAWFIPGEDDTWVVFVHGNGAGRTEALRLAPAVAAAGYPVLVITYRGDADAPPAPDGRHGLGYDEWRDVQAALDFALGAGALDFVLVGYGTGGSIVGTYLYESPDSDRVLGAILDAPMLSLDVAITDAWRDRGIPGWAIAWTKALASMRFGLDLGAIDHVDRAAEWTVPTLILQGRDDAEHPLDSAEAFAIARGSDALLLTFPQAGAGTSWNVDPARYESAVIGFLDSVGAETSEFEPVDP